ncbi:MAG: hypothetical protein ABJI60_14285 [Kangiellaceae bacterium]
MSPNISLQGNGQHQGEQLLSSSLLYKALFYTEERGLRDWQLDNEFGNSHYLLFSWSIVWTDKSNCKAEIPYMSVHGVLITLLPNKVTAVRFAEANNYDPLPLVRSLANIRGLCF